MKRLLWTFGPAVTTYKPCRGAARISRWIGTMARGVGVLGVFFLTFTVQAGE